MKKLLLFTVYYLLFNIYSKAQVNLVPNPSFENLSQCPSSHSQIMYATPWFQTFINVSGNQVSSTDLYSTCCSDNFCTVPNNFAGNQLPRTGNSYVGIQLYFTSSSGYREYIENILNDTLSNGKIYCIDFYISLSDKSKWAVSNIGVYFSNDSCLQVPPPFIELPYNPQIENTDTIIVKDKINWQRISLPYQAQGGERFMTIGNFNNNSNTDTMFVGGATIGTYYYIDDVSVIDISTPAYAGVDTTIAIGDSVFIGRQPEIGLNDDCVWYVNGNPINTVAGLWVMPDSTTTYILEQTICGYTTYDTVTVTVLPTSIESYDKQEQFVIYPNPSNGELWIKLENGLFDQCKVVIYDIAGKVVFDKNMLINNSTKITPNLKQGTYFIHIIPNNYSIKPFKEKITIVRCRQY